MPVDLHIHTTESDGSISPEQVVELAARLRLTAIAISDHDTLSGIAEALAAGNKFGVEVIPAVELSSKYDSRDIHVLGYFISPENSEFLKALEFLRDARIDRAERIVRCLQEHGINISFDEVLSEANGASVGRPHIARVLLTKGYVSSIGDAFRLYLKRGTPCFLEKFVYGVDQAIAMVHKAGGVAVFAHPGLAALDAYIPEFISLGLDGIEAYHSEHTPEMTAHYIELAKKYNLIVTGGSDDHGPRSTHGPRLGSVYVPDEVIPALKRAVEERRSRL